MKAKVLDLLISNNNPSTTASIGPLLISVLLLSVLSGILASFGNVILLIALLGLFGLFFCSCSAGCLDNMDYILGSVPNYWTKCLFCTLITTPMVYCLRKCGLIITSDTSSATK